jgi:hypothetical protein
VPTLFAYLRAAATPGRTALVGVLVVVAVAGSFLGLPPVVVHDATIALLVGLAAGLFSVKDVQAVEGRLVALESALADIRRATTLPTGTPSTTIRAPAPTEPKP